MTVEDSLARVELFSELPRKTLSNLGKSSLTRTYTKGETIIKEGERAVAFYVVSAGRVEVLKDGRRLATFGPGDYFGEMALLDNSPRSADVVALDDTECLVLTTWDFLAELHTNPRVAISLLPVLARRIRTLEDKPTD
jgi:CRP-like cAMP-binding protein